MATYLHPDVDCRLFLAVVLDACSRRVIGWAMDTHPRTELVLDALNMAQAHVVTIVDHL
jgi:transposase InsO family protein